MKKETKVVYTIIRDNNLKEPYFLRIGAAWINKDGSMNVKLNASPLSGELHIRDQKKKEEEII